MNRPALVAGAVALLVAVAFWLMRPVDPVPATPTEAAVAAPPPEREAPPPPPHPHEAAVEEAPSDVPPDRRDAPEIAPGQENPEPRPEPKLASDEFVQGRYEELKEMVRASIAHHEKALAEAQARGDEAEVERRTIRLERAKERMARLEDSKEAVLEDIAAERAAQEGASEDTGWPSSP